MRILHLSYADGGSGAAAEARRLHQAMIALGADSTMLVAHKRTDDPTVHTAFAPGMSAQAARVRSWWECLPNRYAVQPGGFFSTSRTGWRAMCEHHLVRAADVIVLRWITGGYLAPEDLRHLRVPIVWILADTWPFTGGCHYPGACRRFEQNCGHCPMLKRGGERDASRKLWQRKVRVWPTLDLTVAAPSQWIGNLARASSLFAACRHVHIATGTQVDVFRPADKREARARLGLPPDKRIIAFGALGGVSDRRKGFEHLREAIQLSAASGDRPWHLLMFGGAQDDGDLALPAPFLGRLTDPAELALAYSAADVFVAPSVEENLANTCLEALACGTPLLAFTIGGMPDMIEHQQNGYLAADVSGRALAEGLAWCLQDPDRLAALSAAARRAAEQRFDVREKAGRYLQLFAELTTGLRPAHALRQASPSTVA